MKIVWDKTNIGENYPGITLPLTYSFIRDAYSQVYKEFLIRIGLKKTIILEKEYIFDNMLGYIKGQVFYNIENWYKFISLLPGYKYNKKFFETMLDPVTKKRGYKKELIKISLIQKIIILNKFIFQILIFSRLHIYFQKKFFQINNKFEQTNINKLNNSELIYFFKKKANAFFNIWSIAIINDFRVMIFFGLLNKLIKNKKEKEFCLKEVYSLKNRPRSIYPLQDIIYISKQIRQNLAYKKLFKKNSKEILSTLRKKSDLKLAISINNYLNKYGERCANELKLEEPKFRDNPIAFIKLLKKYANDSNENLVKKRLSMGKKKLKNDFKNISFFRKKILLLLKNKSIESIYMREYYRMKRAITFGFARQVFLEFAKRLKKIKDIEKKEDIFYLYQNEIFDYFSYQTIEMDLKKIIEDRKNILNNYRKINLEKRVITQGLPNQKKIIRQKQIKKKSLLQGNPTSRGKVEGSIIIMNELDLNAEYGGKILIAKATDPGWTIIFPLLKGIITEQGGVLSHASVIARELGIPCIVNVENATIFLESKKRISMDGFTGKIKIIK